MADNVTLNSGSGGSTLATDDVTDAGGAHYQRVKLTDGTANSTTHIYAGGGLEANALRVTVASDSTGVLSVDDNGSSLTVDNAALSVVGGGTEAAAMRVTLASDSTGLLSVDDNGSSLTIDNTNIDNLNSSDFDTGAGTDTTPSIGIAVAASGGAAVITGDVTNGLDVDVTRVSGTVTVDGSAVTQPISNAALSQTGGGLEASALRVTIANDSTGLLSVDDNGGSLTVDNAALAITGGGVEASALRVTIATDSTGVLSVDDNGASLTVDNSTLAVVGGGTEAAAMRVTIANDSTGVLSVDDNGGSLTVDGTVTVHTAVAAGGTVSTSQSVTVATSTAATNFGAGGVGVYNYITSVTVHNSSATDGYLVLQDGSGGTTIWHFPAPTTGGATHNFNPPLKQPTANTALYFASSGALTTMYVSINGYQA